MAGKIKKPLLIGISIIVSLIISAGAVVFIMYLGSIGRARDLSEALEKTDGALSYGYLSKAERHLREAADYADNKYDHMRVLKRAYRISEGRQDMTLLAELAAYAVKSVGANDELLTIKSFADLRSNRFERVHQPSDTRGRSLPLASLAVEAFLRSGAVKEAQEIRRPGFPFTMLKLLQSDDPALFEESGIKNSEARLLLDSALLSAYDGKMKEAFRIVKESNREPFFYEPSVFIAYDVGEFEYARDMSGKIFAMHPDRTDILILSGDMALLEGDLGTANDFYNRAITIGKDYAPQPYLNNAYIYQKQGDDGAALSSLRSAYSLFPDDAGVVIEAAKLLFTLSKTSEAGEILSSYVADHPDNPDAALMLINLRRPSMQPKQYRAELWELFNRHPAEKKICTMLLTYLLGIPDIDGAENALNIYRITFREGKEKQPREAWVFHFAGIINALKGNYTAAVSDLNESIALEENEVVRYHRAFVHYISGDLAEARDDCRHALRVERSELSKNRIFYSRVVTLMGETFSASRDDEQAARQFEYALDINPENYRAQALLKQLEENNKKE
ncbi:MAG: tetratricopeptide repeat protein [Spirochaetales bacterium]|nr:tetratricopeptide repeat protein [Spirochaetales bacterium]